MAAARALPEADMLDDEERARAARISHPGERGRFLASRGLLRRAMSSAANGAVPPRGWRFAAGARGKPAVAHGLPPIPFSLSHAGSCVAVATGSRAPVGVDLEGLTREAGSELVEDVLSPGERLALRALDGISRWERFIRIWTVKEACAKALGLGVTMDFAGLEVGFDPIRVSARGAPPAGGPVFALSAWTLAVAGYSYHVAAAVAGEQPETAEFRLRTICEDGHVETSEPARGDRRELGGGSGARSA